MARLKLKESDIQKAILDYLTAAQVFHERLPLGGVRMNSGASSFFRRNPMVGWPDIIGVLPNGLGRLFGIEVKRPGAKLTSKQLERREQFWAAGAVYTVATSVEDVRRMLDLYREKDSA